MTLKMGKSQENSTAVSKHSKNVAGECVKYDTQFSNRQY